MQIEDYSFPSTDYDLSWELLLHYNEGLKLFLAAHPRICFGLTRMQTCETCNKVFGDSRAGIMLSLMSRAIERDPNLQIEVPEEGFDPDDLDKKICISCGSNQVVFDELGKICHSCYSSEKLGSMNCKCGCHIMLDDRCFKNCCIKSKPLFTPKFSTPSPDDPITPDIF